ncbi:MAG TPA: ADP-ribosyltransferase [Streptosporangiaceae bacterium]|nr:ADP-ribosyltransferase [Streptosporangiaceae bacterium]
MAAPAALAEERRDWHGRWAKSGSGPAQKAHGYLVSLTGKVSLRRLHDYDIGDYTREKLDPMRDERTAEQDAAISDYVNHSYEINATARGEDVRWRRFPEETTRARIAAISSAMRPLPDDLVLMREIKGSEALDKFEPGDVIADEGFASTTLRAGRFASGRGGTTIMHILAPRGTPVVWAGRVEDELILDRGQALVLVSRKQTQRGPQTLTEINLLALPKGIAP